MSSPRPVTPSARSPQRSGERDQLPDGRSPVTSARVVVAHRWEDLQASLVSEFAQPPEDVFTIEQVIVSGAGLRRMLPQVLAAHGVVAGVDFSPAAAFWRSLQSELLGIDPATDPWSSHHLTVPVMHLLDAALDEPWAELLRHHVEQPGRPERRFATADRIARLFLRYTRRVPDMIAAWDEGRLVGPTHEPLRAEQLWQPHLWSALVSQLDTPHPAQRHHLLIDALAEQPPSPVRLGVVVTTALPAQERDLLRSLAGVRPVTIWQLNVAPLPPQERQRSTQVSVLGGFGETQREAVTQWHADGFDVELAPSATEPAQTTLLGRVQAHIRGVPAQTDSLAPAHADGTIALHSSHGLDRQVEVLREVLCGLFADDPTLEPRDVVVICPNPSAIAALVQADLGPLTSPSGHPGHQLRVQVARDSQPHPNPAHELVLTLLRLPWSRATSQDLLDLCSLGVVRSRFGFDPDDLSNLRRLVLQADVRWGMDTGHRARWGLDSVGQSTWIAGVDRMLISSALGVDPPTWMGTATPIGTLESTEIDLAGTLAEVVSRIRKTTLGFEPAPVAVWGQRLMNALDLLAAPPPEGEWMLQQVRRSLAELMADPAVGDLTATEVAALLEARPVGSTRPAFGNGGLQVCGLTDLDGFAHRVVVVIGLDDERFPPRTQPVGDDLTADLAVDPITDSRALARQRLLNTMVSAQDHLAVIYQGRDERSNESREPTVPVLALRSAITSVMAPQADLTGVAYSHTLQPHSVENFRADGDAEPLSFDHLALAGLSAQQANREHPSPPAAPWTQTLSGPAVASGPGSGALTQVTLADLVTFFKHPARALMTRATGVSMHEWRDDLPDSLPVDLRGLSAYHAGNRLLTDLLTGTDPATALRAEHLRGVAPPGALGSAQLQRTMDVATRLARLVTTRQDQGPPAHHEIDLEISLPTTSARVVGGVSVSGNTLVDYDFAYVKGAHFVSIWLRLLALAAAHPGRRWTGSLIRNRGAHTITAPEGPEALRILTEWVTLWQQGQDQIVLLPPDSMAAYSGLVMPFGSDQDPPLTRASRQWDDRERDEDWELLAPLRFADLWASSLPDGRPVQAVAVQLWDDLRDAAKDGRP